MNTRSLQQFPGYQAPAELMRLKAFQDDYGEFSEGFFLTADYKTGISTWSEDPGFLDRLMPFAQANASGSIYAFWNDGSDRALDLLPIVVFGDEGGVHLVADGIRELMRILSYDTEITVDYDEVYFYKDEEYYVESVGSSAYREWIGNEFGIQPPEAPDEIIAAAQLRYAGVFRAWFRNYVPDDESGS